MQATGSIFGGKNSMNPSWNEFNMVLIRRFGGRGTLVLKG